ncbi:solute carrier family 36 (proton-coupled amino acid transporter) [Acrasis kona]|uniref:Solute carrier family 36 (Proton-coupled amino acid transporter) n=1 Tax=Acrasis kona TaxID=1008807 RepID=A0AAW2YYR2_9EUKA
MVLYKAAYYEGTDVEEKEPITKHNAEEPINKGEAKSTDFQALVNIIKANIGSGILTMPFAYKNGGVILGTIALVTVALITMHCITLLVKCKKKLVRDLKARKREQGEDFDENEIVTYGDVGKETMGKFGTAFISTLLVFTQTGFCCAYLNFIGGNMHEMVPALREWHYIIISLVVLIPICLIRNLKHLSLLSIISEILMLAGMGIVIYFDIFTLSTTSFPGDRRISTFDFKNFPVFFGICIFGFEGIGLALPVESNMKNKKHFKAVLYTAESLVGIMMGVFGLFGYIAFAHNVQSMITLNIPSGSSLGIVIKVGFIIALAFTYPMQLFPVSELFDGYLDVVIEKFKRKPSGDESQFLFNPTTNSLEVQTKTSRKATLLRWIAGSVMRAVVIILTAVLAASIPDFGSFLSLIGGLGGTLLAFVLPCIIHIIVYRKEMHWYVFAKDISIATFGILASAITTWTAIDNMIKGRKGGH